MSEPQTLRALIHVNQLLIYYIKKQKTHKSSVVIWNHFRNLLTTYKRTRKNKMAFHRSILVIGGAGAQGLPIVKGLS